MDKPRGHNAKGNKSLRLVKITEREWWLTKTQRGREIESCFLMGPEFQYKMKRFTETDSGAGYSIMQMYLMMLNYTLKMITVNFMCIS